MYIYFCTICDFSSHQSLLIGKLLCKRDSGSKFYELQVMQSYYRTKGYKIVDNNLHLMQMESELQKNAIARSTAITWWNTGVQLRKGVNESEPKSCAHEPQGIMFFHEHDILVAFIRKADSVPLRRIPGTDTVSRITHTRMKGFERVSYFGADVSMQPPGGPPSRDTSYDRPNQNSQEKDDARKKESRQEEKERRKRSLGIAAQQNSR